jgi:DNA-binding transcriptional ArsR family regulator
MSRAASQTARRAAEAAPVFFALGDETRLRLLLRLSQEGPLSIARLSEGVSMTRQAISKHLSTLEASGLLRASRRGRERVYELESARLQAAKRYLDSVSLQWDEALDRLRAMVEAE